MDVSISALPTGRVSPALVDLDMLLRQIQHERQWDHAASSMTQRRAASGGECGDTGGATDRGRDWMEGDDDKTCMQIRDVFARMGIKSSLSFPQSSSSTRHNKSRVKRWYAVQGAHLYSWQFAEISRLASVSDANTQQFPYELLRSDRVVRDGENGRDDSEEDQKVLEKGRFLLNFNQQFVNKAVNLLNQARDQSARLKITFGRTLFHLDALLPGVEYTREFVLEAHRSGYIRTSWSNILDADSSVPQALLADLMSAVKNTTSTTSPKSKELLTVYLKFRTTRQRDLKVTYTREDEAQWKFYKCRLNSGTRYAFDASLDDRVSFRARVYEKVDASVEEFERTRSSLTVQLGENHATSTPRVTLLEGSPLQLDDAVVEKIWRTRETIVLFQCLNFKIIEAVRDCSELHVEARLPAKLSKSTAEPSASLGARFETILTRMQAILAAYH